MVNYLLYFQVKECPQCQHSARIKTMTRELISIPSEGPWDVIGVDMVGPLTKTESGHVYICTMTDLFTKFVYAKPVKVLPTGTVHYPYII